MPDQLAINVRRVRVHHAVDPVWVPEGLVDDGGFVVEGAIHGQEVAALHGDRAAGADFGCADGDCDADLSGHAGPANVK
jgi:hypothetical protein